MSSRPRRAAAAAAPRYVEDGSDSESSQEEAEKPKSRKGAKRAAAAKKREVASDDAVPAPKRAKTDDEPTAATKEAQEASEADSDAATAVAEVDLVKFKDALSRGADATNALEAATMDSSTKASKKMLKWLELVKAAVEAGAKVASRPFVTHVVCRADAPEIVKYLIAQGAVDLPPNIDSPKEKAWYYAAFWDRKLCGQVLLDLKWASLAPGSLDIEVQRIFV